MIGWCAADRINRGSRVVHASAVCDRFRHGHPTRVVVRGDRMWGPPYRMASSGVLFRWCDSCRKIPALGSWRDAAACLGSSDDWITPGHATERLKQLCRDCFVAKECAEYADLIGARGVWGGVARG